MLKLQDNQDLGSTLHQTMFFFLYKTQTINETKHIKELYKLITDKVSNPIICLFVCISLLRNSLN